MAAGAARRGHASRLRAGGRTGRRPGRPETREAILAAARAGFSGEGYDGATIRGIARLADVDPALVHHYFGTKEELFVAAMELPVRPSEMVPALLAPGPEGLGERILRMFFAVWESDSGGSLQALIRSAASNERAAAMLREFVGKELIGRIARALEVDHADLRATLAGSQIMGLGMARYVIRVEPLASADRETVIAAVAPTFQRYLAGDLGLPRRGSQV
jgi:AcrR family transcriptional regulator